MSRPASLAVAGYYPTPAHLIPRIAQLINAAPAFEGRLPYAGASSLRYGEYLLADPCAGDGAALVALARHLFLGPKTGATADLDPATATAAAGDTDATTATTATGSGGSGDTPGETLASLNRATGPSVTLLACEMEAGRAQALEKRLGAELGGQNGYRYHALHADAFSVMWEKWSRSGANVLYLNPPYGVDNWHGRLEQRFLARFTPLLASGEGILIFVVPHYALGASAAYLARHYEEISAYRFPDEDFAIFKQVVLIARRAWHDLALPGGSGSGSGLGEGAPAALVRQIEAWAADASLLPALPDYTSPLPPTAAGFDGAGGLAGGGGPAYRRLSLAAHSQGGIGKIEVARFDVPALSQVARPWCVGTAGAGADPFRANAPTPRPLDPATPTPGGGVWQAKARTGGDTPNPKGGKAAASGLAIVGESGLEKGLFDFVGQPFPVAMPPKPAHIAMALAAGVFNGKRLDPNMAAPLSVPAIMAKGVFKGIVRLRSGQAQNVRYSH